MRKKLSKVKKNNKKKKTYFNIKKMMLDSNGKHIIFKCNF